MTTRPFYQPFMPSQYPISSMLNRGNEQGGPVTPINSKLFNEPSSKNENGIHYKIVQMKFKIEPQLQGSKLIFFLII